MKFLRPTGQGCKFFSPPMTFHSLAAPTQDTHTVGRGQGPCSCGPGWCEKGPLLVHNQTPKEPQNTDDGRAAWLLSRASPGNTPSDWSGAFFTIAGPHEIQPVPSEDRILLRGLTYPPLMGHLQFPPKSLTSH